MRWWAVYEAPRGYRDVIVENGIEIKDVILVKDVEKCGQCVYRMTDCRQLETKINEHFCVIQRPKIKWEAL
jgi:hypothetical protein